MKKKLLSPALAALLVFSMAGCGDKIKTELPMEGIKSMICTPLGTMYILSGNGLRTYDVGGNKALEYLYDANDLSMASFEWTRGGERIVYNGLYIERLLGVGEDGINMVGKYTTNTLGQETELFVVQDAYDLNYSAAYFTEIKPAGKDFVNGSGADSTGVYFKLNTDGVDGGKYTDGMKLDFYGHVYPHSLPDGVTGAIPTDSKDKKAASLFLVETDERVELTDGEKAVKSYERKDVADAFTNGDGVYVIYKDGHVTKTDKDGKETDFMELGFKFSDVNDAALYDGELYWFDKTGIRTSK